MRITAPLLVATVMLALSACQLYPPTERPDYAIHVASTPQGDVAVPPSCPGWAASSTDPYDNQPVPQFGCASARNLALSVERPDDLLQGRELGPQRAVTSVGAIRRYDNNQTRGLIDPESSADSATAVTTAPSGASTLTGDVTGGPGASTSSATTPTSTPSASSP